MGGKQTKGRNGILSLEKELGRRQGGREIGEGGIKIVYEEDEENRKIKTNSGENVLEGGEACTSWQQP